MNLNNQIDSDNSYISSDSEKFSSEDILNKEYEEEQREMLKKYSTLDAERYESFRRTNITKNEIRKLVSRAIDQTCNLNFQIAVSAISKVFVGEMVETMLEIRDEEEKGPKNTNKELKPSHAHEAYRKLRKNSRNLKNRKKRYNFRK